MTQQLLDRTGQRHRGGPPAAGLPDAELSDVRDDGQRFIDEGLAIVDQALSRDSQSFLAASGQLPGQ